MSTTYSEPDKEPKKILVAETHESSAYLLFTSPLNRYWNARWRLCNLARYSEFVLHPINSLWRLRYGIGWFLRCLIAFWHSGCFFMSWKYSIKSSKSRNPEIWSRAKAKLSPESRPRRSNYAWLRATLFSLKSSSWKSTERSSKNNSSVCSCKAYCSVQTVNFSAKFRVFGGHEDTVR